MLGRLFGKKSASELEAEAQKLFEAGQWGEAKLAYDRLEERAEKDRDPELAQRAASLAAVCCDKLAEARIKEAQVLAQNGHLDLAREELRHALETARGSELQSRVRAAQAALERKDAVAHAQAPATLSDEERAMLIQSAWEPLQGEELESYGDPLMEALLALERGEVERALDGLETLIASAKQPSYLWLELGRARLARDDQAGAQGALRMFLSRIGPDEGGAARIAAHRELARIAHEKGDKDAAVAELEACAAALEEDPRPLLELGSYLRLIGRAAEAIEVIELCAGLFPEGRVEWPVTMELGLAAADAGDRDRAVLALESVLETLAARGHTDFPPLPTVRLARLHEEAGNLTRAADLYRILTEGSDGPNHALYHAEAARLLEQLGLAEEARRMRERAAGLERSPPVS
jgi:tetratricopeptide (TPR) repeat protein